MKIDNDSPEHPYVQLAGLLRERIKVGKTGPRVPVIRFKVWPDVRRAATWPRQGFHEARPGSCSAGTGRGAVELTGRPPDELGRQPRLTAGETRWLACAAGQITSSDTGRHSCTRSRSTGSTRRYPVR